jgi:hypothetical protein
VSVGRWTSSGDETHASDDGKQVFRVRFRQSARRVHLVNDERDVGRAQLLDEQVTEKIIVLG